MSHKLKREFEDRSFALKPMSAFLALHSCSACDEPRLARPAFFEAGARQARMQIKRGSLCPCHIPLGTALHPSMASIIKTFPKGAKEALATVTRTNNVYLLSMHNAPDNRLTPVR